MTRLLTYKILSVVLYLAAASSSWSDLIASPTATFWAIHDALANGDVFTFFFSMIKMYCFVIKQSYQEEPETSEMSGMEAGIQS